MLLVLLSFMLILCKDLFKIENSMIIAIPSQIGEI